MEFPENESLQLVGGWVYVAMTSSNYDRFKIGRTGRNPLARMAVFRTSDPGLALEAAYFVPASHGRLSRVESALHRQFGGRIRFHDESLSEWFAGSARWGCERVEEIFESWHEAPVADFSQLDQDRICRGFESDLHALFAAPRRPPNGIPW